VNKGKTSYGSVLNLAMVKGQVHLISDILSHKANPMSKDSKGNTALHYCMALFDRDTKIYT
jgi:ankyrin repeat protein